MGNAVLSCHAMVKQARRVFVGDKRDLPPLMTESLFHGYIGAPTIGLMTHPLLDGNNGSLDPGTCQQSFFGW